jgi:hypothetical protein
MGGIYVKDQFLAVKAQNNSENFSVHARAIL